MTRRSLFRLRYLCLAVLGTLPLPGHAQSAEPAKAAETVPAPLASTAADEIERTRPGSQPLKYELPPIDPRQVERAVKLSKEKYCSATIMLAKTAEIETTIAIVDGDRVPLPGALTDGQAPG